MVDKKMVFVCGDFHVDLLYPNEHKKNRDFIDTMYSISLFPTILKSSRITSDSIILIDNIFTSEIGSRVVSGLFLNDSDHLPVFATLQNFFKIETHKDPDSYRLIRHRTPEAIGAFKGDLRKQSWNEVYSNDPNKACEFLFYHLI